MMEKAALKLQKRALTEKPSIRNCQTGKKAKADAKSAEEAKKAKSVLKKLLAGGMSADEILEKLK